MASLILHAKIQYKLILFFDSIYIYGLYGGTQRGMGAILRAKGGVTTRWSFRAYRQRS